MTMLLIWKGRGFMVIILTVLSLAFSLPCASTFVTMTNYVNETAIQIGMVLLYAGVFIRTFFVFFPAKPPKHYIDTDTGKDVFVTNVDSLYYLDVKYWAYGFMIIGVLLFGISFGTAVAI